MSRVKNPPPTNIKILAPYHKRLRPGDLFAIGLPNDMFLFGRLVTNEANAIGVPGAHLIYIYRPQFDTMHEPPRPALSKDNLLLTPLFINRLPWSRGYFAHIAHWPLEPGDTFDVHGRYDVYTKKYFDEFGNELPGPVEAMMPYGLGSFRTVDDLISTELGFELAPD